MRDCELVFELEGLDCANCAAKIERKVMAMPEIASGEVNFMQRSMRVVLEDKSQEKPVEEKIESIVHSFEPDVTVRRRFSASGSVKTPAAAAEDDGSAGVGLAGVGLEGVGFEAAAADPGARAVIYDSAALPGSVLDESAKQEKQIASLRIRIAAGAAVYAAAFVLDHWTGAARPFFLALYLVSYLILGFPVLLKAASNIFKGMVFDENFLMAIATIGALSISQWSEAVAVMLFYQVGEYFQSTAVHRSRRSISELLQIRPDYANVQKGGTLVRVSPESVNVGDMIVVKPGEKVPLDGVVSSGSSSLDTSALTGESVFRDVEPGDTILSGCINKQGVLTIEVKAAFGESTVSKIIEMVTNAGSRKTRSENLITRFAAVYTPVVVLAAVLLALIPPLLFDGNFSVWIYRALSFLVISCPCALVISVPLGYFGGIGAASKRGILIKGSNFLDALDRTDSIVFDKTGTLTKGVFSVSGIVPAGNISEEDLLKTAAGAEAYSDHPVALSVKKAARERGIIPSCPEPEAYKEITGRGVAVQTGTATILVGNRKMMTESGINDVPDAQTAGTLLFVSINHIYAGYIEIADEVKTEAADAIAQLRRLNIKKIAMLTGDRTVSAMKTAGELGITEVYSEMLPAGKLEKIEEILARRMPSRKSEGTLLYVGDGINDAPVLVRADIGAAIGAMASGAAIEAADIVIMTDDLEALPRAIRIAKKTRRIVTENIIFALSVKAVILILAALGLTNLWFAIFADVGVAVLAILNSVRAGR